MRLGTRRADVVWPLRRLWLVRRLLTRTAAVLAAMVAVLAAIGAALAAAFGHPVVWAVIGFVLGVVPLAGLIVVLLLGGRAGVAAGPGWIGLRLLGRWRTLDLGQVRSVRLSDESWLPGGLARGAGHTLLLEGESGDRIPIAVSMLDVGLGDVLRRGLGPGAVIDAEAQQVLGEAAEVPGDQGRTRPPGHEGHDPRG